MRLWRVAVKMFGEVVEGSSEDACGEVPERSGEDTW